MYITVNGVDISIENNSAFDPDPNVDACDAYAVAVESATMVSVMGDAYDHLYSSEDGLLGNIVGATKATVKIGAKTAGGITEIVNKLVYVAQKIWDQIIKFFKSLIQFIASFIEGTAIKIRAKSLLEKIKEVDKLHFDVKVKANKIIYDFDVRKAKIKSLQSALDKANKKLKSIANSHFKNIIRTAANITVAVNIGKLGVRIAGLDTLINIAELGIVAAGVASYATDAKKTKSMNEDVKVSAVFKNLKIPTNAKGIETWLTSLPSALSELKAQRSLAIENERNSTTLSKVAYVEKVNGALSHRAIDFDRKVMQANQLAVKLQNEIVSLEVSRIQAGLNAISAAING